MDSVLFCFIKQKNISVGDRFSASSMYKYKKFFKIKYNFSDFKPFYYHSCNLELFFQIQTISTRVRLFKTNNLKSVKMFVRKPYTKIISFHVYPYKGFTKKPSEVRMGKGKGSKIAFRAFPMRCGSLIARIPERFRPAVTSVRTIQRFIVYSNKFNSFTSKIFRGFFLFFLECTQVQRFWYMILLVFN